MGFTAEISDTDVQSVTNWMQTALNGGDTTRVHIVATLAYKQVTK
jgi:hypothetical protein